MGSEFSKAADDLREKLKARADIAKGLAVAAWQGDAAMTARLAAAAARLDEGGTQTMFMAVQAMTPEQARTARDRLADTPAGGIDLYLLALRAMLDDHARGRLREPYGLDR